MAYLVLARKYRSATFEEVVGQEHIATTLVNAIKTGRIAHAFLFAGTRGVGKTTVARILAKALNCLNAPGDTPTPTPCNTCDACIAIARGDDVDVVEIDGASNRGIDEIRELRSNAIYRPSRCRYKVYYIDEVHMLTKEAFNALLKTLEEPPGHVKFIFATTEADRLPATILSRCQRFDFRNIPTRDIAEHLTKICQAEKVTVDKAAIFRIARAAAGSMRDGLSLLDQLLAAGSGTVGEEDVIRVLGTPGEERTAEIVGAIAGGDPAAALGALDRLLTSGVTLESAIAAIGEMFRYMMLIQSCGADSDLVELPESQRGPVAELAGRFTLPALVGGVTLCQQTLRNLRGLSSGRGLAEAALVRLAAADKFVDVASLTARLEALAAGGRTGPAGQAPAGRGPSRTPYRPPEPPGQKKKDLTPADGPAEPPAGRTGLQWEGEYLQGHWHQILDELARRRHGHLAGLLGPAKVLGVEGDTLRLGFDEPHEPLRRRCSEGMAPQIAAALGGLFGRCVQCEYVPTGESGGASAGAPAARKPVRTVTLPTAERAKIANDPAVKVVTDLFGGALAEVRRVGPEERDDMAADG
ncbi:MAG TPA: DNA polymerase III subunit gamma/tau [Phycisphaerae bacterium]|nr:DNA polymerase III subunit gamma/tau [Phycisphaerae bacterium]